MLDHDQVHEVGDGSINVAGFSSGSHGKAPDCCARISRPAHPTARSSTAPPTGPTVAEIERQLARVQGDTGIDPIAPESARRTLHLNIATAVRLSRQAIQLPAGARDPSPPPGSDDIGLPALRVLYSTLSASYVTGVWEDCADDDEHHAHRQLIDAGHIYDSGHDVSAPEQLLWSLYPGGTEYRSRDRLGVPPPSQPEALRNLTPI